MLYQWIIYYKYNRGTIVFITDGHVFFCLVYDQQVPCIKIFKITQHVNTSSYNDSLKLNMNNNKQMLLGNVYKSKTNNFNEDFCLALVAANIPWFKLQIPKFKKFKDFLQKYTNQHIWNGNLLRKSYLEPRYIKTIENTKEKEGDLCIFSVVDETTNVNDSL